MNPVDTAQHKAYEAVLRSDPPRYTELVRDISAYGIYLLGPDGDIQSWNRGAELITGLRAADVLARPYQTLFDGEQQRQGVPQKTLDFVRAHRHFREDQQRRRADGSPFIADVTVEMVRRNDGRILGFVEIIHDITERKQREQALYAQATEDALTGVCNRGHFQTLAEQEIERARRFSEPLSVAMLGIDHFKSVNDTYGHEVGDRAIIALAETCRDFVRKIDTVGRIGGEEFAILFPRAAIGPAYEMCNRLRLRIAQHRISLPPGSPQPVLGYTVSIGVAALGRDTADLKALLRHADAALYRSKHEGRNRVTAWAG